MPAPSEPSPPAFPSLLDDSPDIALLRLGPDCSLTCGALEQAAHQSEPRVVLTPQADEAIQRAYSAFQHLRAEGAPIYGVTTGFGPFVQYGSSDSGAEVHGAGLIAHLGTGYGTLAAPSIVRATMILRAQSVAQGHSGIARPALQAYLDVLRTGLVPAVPSIGSVGASGDLTPLAHIARVVTGEGRVYTPDGPTPARAVLDRHGLQPYPLNDRDALALVNGTNFLTAYAALALQRTRRLIARAEQLTGWLYRLLGCPTQALDDRLHAARGHAGQRASAAAIRTERARGPIAEANRPLQEIYSIRCAPQVLGSCRDQVSYAARLIETEMNGVTDNPLTFPGSSGDGATPCVLHGGNFQGQQVAFAADALNAAITQTGLLVERQIDALLSPSINDNAPLLLAWSPGADSGLAGAQLTATAAAAELRAQAQMHATATIPTNGGNQDIVSMGTMAARRAFDQTRHCAIILAVASLALHQLTFLRREGRSPGTAVDKPDWVPPLEPLRGDRALHSEITSLADAWLAPNS